MPNLQVLEVRRRALGMTYDALAKRSEVPASTVKRILSGNVNSSFTSVVSVAEALGMGIIFSQRLLFD